MMSLSSWYQQHDSLWSRFRRTPQPSLDPAMQAPNTPHQRNNADNNPTNSPNGPQQNQKKVFEPLFGPALGVVTQGPPWTISTEKKVVTDDLTPEVVSTWVEKSKEPSQPTTTLQALVNLKRPTLRLSPLTSSEEDPSHEHHHGLEFEYDCDAPKCGIYLYVFLPKDHPDAPATHYPMAKLLVFEAVVDGGFGRTLKLEEGAVLELGRWEYVAGRTASPAAAETSGLAPVPEAMSSSSSGDGSRPNTGINNSNGNTNQHRRRFTHFHFRKRSQNRSVSGPALAVVDAEPQEAAPTNKKEGAGESKEEALEGIRVTIRLAALDEQGSELASPNEQITYLHVVRFGPKPVVAEGEEPVEDTRPWVVKVVKREATIGPHTFQLHEIYGLTSSSTHTYAPTSALPAAPHTYPPDASSPTVQPATPPEDDDPQSECLLCLSEPREVVLLPCRHLVACKDCAVNMVEFGAGGNIVQPVEPAPAADTPTDGDANANSQGEGGSAPATATSAPITPTTNPRRKRKAKGWFCPVCRQPYTSLLRITTSPPPPSTSKDEGRSSGEEEGAAALAVGASPLIVEGGNGLLGGMLRPGFLRGLSLRAGAAPPDVESTAGLGRQGA